MNSAAQFTLRILGGVLLVFALAIVVFPIFNLTTPPIIEKSMDSLIVAFVAMLARLGTSTDSTQSVGNAETVNQVTAPAKDGVE